MSHPTFPLPEGHVYAWGGGSKRHLGQSDHEAIWLSVAQRALKQRWGFTRVDPSGSLDLATQTAVEVVQEAIGHTPDGQLDKETWDAIFTHPIVKAQP